MSAKDDARRHARSIGGTDDEVDFAGRLAEHPKTLEELSSMLEVLPREALIHITASLILTVSSFDAEEALEQAARMMNMFDKVLTGEKR